MDIQKEYELWLEKAVEDPDLKTELEQIKDKPEEISDRFYRELEFGTAGLRGVIGAGTNRMNVYTVKKATQGLAEYILSSGIEKSVAIGYDSRIKSTYFAESAAEVLAANGIKVHIYKELMPTPMLSWAVRHLKCGAGIVVTASHNPAKYNGYKVYGADGCQMTSEAADAVLAKINNIDTFSGVKSTDFKAAVDSGTISYIDDSVIDAYIAKVKEQSLHTDVVAKSGLKVVYSPLNGTGNKPVRRILSEIGVTNVVVVPEQENPDGNFPTCPFPNPEIREALAVGLKLCDKEKPDLMLATDPDCDRVGIAVPDGDGYELFSGNETGALLLEYVCRERLELGRMPKNPVAVKTIVTSDITKAIAKKYGVELREVLTGFKYIGEQVGLLEAAGEEERYVFGFEESYGYLAGGYVRDKDAVVASMLICEMAAFYRSKGISMIEARKRLYDEYGVFLNKVENFGFEGEAGMTKMKEIMANLRSSSINNIGGLKVLATTDYKASVRVEADGSKSEIKLPKSDVITYNLEDDASIIIRPSGTEPKIKVYYTTKAPARDIAVEIQKELSGEFTKILGI
ncbi:MAG: phospho-sugar mutase [Oscillospiraceae bacterium]|nr:phospho-sugar mutase [Oscillospiraceae bacterium]MCH5207932.1 phospho-sugar mutase [Oscillospiraceae bacterium]